MCKAHFEIETSCSHPEWYRYPLEYIFTPYAEPGKARETVRRTHPDLDRQMRFAADGPREWVLFGVRLSGPPPAGAEPLWIDVTVYCDGRPVRHLRHEASDLYHSVSGAHVYYAANYAERNPAPEKRVADIR
ncbi:hypothetical protein [Rikenella microfusus]|uniref:hypothetical protein n=1 Tax=Rikenella microfusus TaxID=28139 RepID=UPI00248DE63C|nr:hypothetical protein [Rikenella microfusus]